LQLQDLQCLGFGRRIIPSSTANPIAVNYFRPIRPYDPEHVSHVVLGNGIITRSSACRRECAHL